MDAVSFIGKVIALFGSQEHRFVQMRADGVVGILDDANMLPANIGIGQQWERFTVIDAGGGEVAFHNRFHNRFLRLNGDSVDGYGGPRNATDLPADWLAERFRIIDAGNGKFALHNASHNRFIRVCGGMVDARGGPMNVE
ncbi:MAG: fascin domain-containing protein, partial [bacterium]